MERKYIVLSLVILTSVLGVLSLLACTRALAFNNMFAAYEEALNMARAHGVAYPLFENVTYYSMGLTRNRTSLLFENVGTGQFIVSSVLWCPSDQMESSSQALKLTPEEYDMNPSSGIIQPNCTVLVTVKWGVSGGNISETEWFSNKSYFWQLVDPRGSNFGMMVKPGEDVSAQAAERVANYRETQIELETHSQSFFAQVLAEKWVVNFEMYMLICSTAFTSFASVYAARRFQLGIRVIFDRKVIAIVLWIVLFPFVLFVASVVPNVVRYGLSDSLRMDFWSPWCAAALSVAESYFLELWVAGCVWGILFIYLISNYRRRFAVPFYKSLCLSLLSLAVLLSAFAITLPLTDSLVATAFQASVGTFLAIIAACAAFAAPFLKKARKRFEGARKLLKTKVKLTSSDFAIIVGGFALLISMGFPLINYYIALNSGGGEPSLQVTEMYVSAYYTSIELANFGNATSWNIQLELIYEGHGIPAIVTVRATEFIPKLERDDTVLVRLPIGRCILSEQSSDLSRYTATLTIESDETPVQNLDFHPFLTIGQSN